jgi:SAM-dependent methyltransferase
MAVGADRLRHTLSVADRRSAAIRTITDPWRAELRIAAREADGSTLRRMTEPTRRSESCPSRETREQLARTFDSAAGDYDRARPAYPEELFDDLVELAGLEPGSSRLLEIGCATGKATRPLLERGFSIVCVEMGPQLAERARRNLAGFPFEIHVDPFEEWECQPEAFDLVYAATAWHWLAPTRYRKAHALLRPDGHLAFWSAFHAFPAGYDEFFAEIQEVYDAIGEGKRGEWPPPAPEQIPDEVSEIEATGLFEGVQVRRYVWETQYTADEYIALLDTFSGHIAMDAAKREHLDREIRRRITSRPGQRVRRDWYSILHVARAEEGVRE